MLISQVRYVVIVIISSINLLVLARKKLLLMGDAIFNLIPLLFLVPLLFLGLHCSETV